MKCAGNAPFFSRSGRIASGITWRRRRGAVLGRPRARVPKVSPEMVGSLLRGNDFGGNPQEGGNNTPMIEDCTLPEWGRKARMGLPAKSPQAILWGPQVGGVTILPCQGQNFTRRQGKTGQKGDGNENFTPCGRDVGTLRDNFTRRQGKTGQKGDGNENFTPCGRDVGTLRDFVGICRLIAENGVLASRAGGADGA